MEVTRLLLLLGLLVLQLPPGVTGEPRGRGERARVAEETDVDSLTSRTGTLVPVLVESLEGLPAAAAEREAFLRGFRGAFQQRELPTERLAPGTGEAKPGPSLRNGLRLAEGMDEEGAWRARVRLAWVAPPDSAPDERTLAWPGRSARLTVAAAWPEDARKPPPPLTRSEWLRFPAGHPVDAAYYQHCGWQVGYVALEAVLRAKGDLDDRQRLRLDDTRRLAPPPPPR